MCNAGRRLTLSTLAAHVPVSLSIASDVEILGITTTVSVVSDFLGCGLDVAVDLKLDGIWRDITAKVLGQYCFSQWVNARMMKEKEIVQVCKVQCRCPF